MDIAYLNQKLRDALGNAPSGDPKFKWIHAKDLTIRQRDTDGTWVDFPQLSETSTGDGNNPCAAAPRWVLATWMPPQHTLEQYRAMFGGSMPYPRNGRYVVTDIVLVRGAVPTEAVTDNVIGKEKARRRLVESQRREAISAGRDRVHMEGKRKAQDIISACFPAFKHAPGKKDHVSFGGI
jgi:hypothetical protein